MSEPGPPPRSGGGFLRLVQSGLVVSVAVLAANASNFVFQVGTGRLLTSDEYGLLLAAFTLLGLLSMGSSAIMTAVSKQEAVGSAAGGTTVAGRERGVAHAIRELRDDRLAVHAVVGGLAAGAAMAAASPLVAEFLHADIGVALALAASVPTISTTAVVYGRLQGRQQFRAFAAIALAVAAAKLAGGLGVVAGGLGTTAVLAVVAATTFGASVWGLVAVRTPGSAGFGPVWREILRSLLVLIFWRAIIGMDVPLARYWLSDRTTGQYAAAAVIGRGILWLPEIVSFVLFPSLASAAADGRDASDDLRRALAIVVGLCSLGAAALWALGPTIFDLLYGSQYPDAADLAWKVALASIPASAANLFLFASLARRESAWIGALALAVAAQVGALVAFHGSPTQLIIGSGLGGVLALVITYRVATRPVPRLLEAT